MATVKPPVSHTPPQADHNSAPAGSDVSLKPTPLMRLRLYQAKWDMFLANRHFTALPSLIAAIGCIILLGLGTWQIARLYQKNAQITHITTQLQQGEIDLRLKPPVDAQAWHDLDYKAVILQGEWLDLHNLKILPRTYEGQNGYHVVTPFRLSNGQVILVNRGWAPDKMEIGMQSQNGTTIVAGVIRSVPDAKPFGMADNTPAHITRNEWTWPDTQAISQTIGIGTIPPIILYMERQRTAAQEHEYPIGGQVQLAIRNEHRNYALTWYMMAMALLTIWLAASQKRHSTEVSDQTISEKDIEQDRDDL